MLETGSPMFPSGLVYRRAWPYTWSVAYSFYLFGFNELAARLPSLVSNLIAVGLVFWAARRYFGLLTAVLAGLLLAFSPFEIVWARASRMYTMYQLFFLLGAFTFYRGFEREAETDPIVGRTLASQAGLRQTMARMGWGWLALSALFILVAYKLQPLALLFGVSLLVYAITMFGLELFREGPRAAFNSRYFLAAALALTSGGALLAVPAVRMTIARLQSFAPAWAERVPLSPTFYLQFLVSPIFFPVLAFFALGAIQICARLHRFGFYLLVVFAVPFGYHSFFANVQSSRYIFEIIPLIMMVAAYGLAHFILAVSREFQTNWSCHLARPGLGKALEMAAGLVMISIFSLLFYYPLSTSVRIPSKTTATYGGEFNGQWREACQYINSHKGSDDVLVVSIPLAADFHGCGNVRYNLNNGEIEQFRTVEGSAFKLDAFTNTRAIVELGQFMRVLRDHPRGWVAMDAQRFKNPAITPPDIRDCISARLKPHTSRADATMMVFSWDEATSVNACAEVQ
ncbi:MAG: glycosyltransferase family 39 protein [Syntrophobacteraceae bacterium]|nr:glycosyltransferase family 39 protein [Syntrophobacteraceae bacterium]